VTFELAPWKPWIAAWSNVCWKVEPYPFSVTFDDPFEDLLELPQAPATSASAATAVKARAARENRKVGFKIRPFQGRPAAWGMSPASVSTLRTRSRRESADA